MHMHSTYARTLITLGTILALAQVIGIPLGWKQWISVCVALIFVGWGVYARYYEKPQQETYDRYPTI